MRKMLLPLITVCLTVGAATVLAGWNEGVAAFQSKDFDLAIAEFQEVVRQNPESWRGHYMLGLALAQKGRNEEALDHLRKAHELNLDDLSVNLALGRVYLNLFRQLDIGELGVTIPQAPKPCPVQTVPGGPEAPIDLCDVGFEISRMTPCTSAEDCPAHGLWSSALGPPGPRSAQPERDPEISRPTRADGAVPVSPGDDR